MTIMGIEVTGWYESGPEWLVAGTRFDSKRMASVRVVERESPPAEGANVRHAAAALIRVDRWRVLALNRGAVYDVELVIDQAKTRVTIDAKRRAAVLNLRRGTVIASIKTSGGKDVALERVDAGAARGEPDAQDDADVAVAAADAAAESASDEASDAGGGDTSDDASTDDTRSDDAPGDEEE